MVRGPPEGACSDQQSRLRQGSGQWLLHPDGATPLGPRRGALHGTDASSVRGLVAGEYLHKEVIDKTYCRHAAATELKSFNAHPNHDTIAGICQHLVRRAVEAGADLAAVVTVVDVTGQDPHEAALAIFGAPLHSLEALRIIGDDMVKYDNPFAEGRHAEWFAAILGQGLKGDMLFANGIKLALQPWLDHLHTAGNVTPDTLKQWLADAYAIHHECCYGEATGERLKEYARQCFESISP
ncbi:hypothetical protein JKP88DRAFT_241916 [Tribonema minus]|uniref:Uncharacterized protein n=1 Tax=Tribonema minus TaxID=303371 RepID=A0A835YQ23_9STRA|nr:hypothetical protein JKP88DRAFT_241916 [Tribonema minus]